MEVDSQEHIQAVFDSMSRHSETMIADGGSSHHTEISWSQIRYSSNHLCIVMYLICGINFISVTYMLLGVASFTNSHGILINMRHTRQNEKFST